MPANIGGSSLSTRLKQIELVTKLIESGSASSSRQGSAESANSSPKQGAGNLLNMKR